MTMAYAFNQFDPERMARATVRDAGISFKKSIELAKRLRGMMSDRAERYLDEVIALKAAVPFTRFTNGAGHRRGAMGPGKYPVKAASSFRELLKQCVANAENKGLGTPLKIISLIPQQAARPVRYGRKRGHQSKRTHVEIVLVETDESKKRDKKAKPAKAKDTTPAAAKPAAKSVESKPVAAKPAEKPVEAKSAAAKPAAKAPEAKPAKESPKESKSESKDVKKDGD